MPSLKNTYSIDWMHHSFFKKNSFSAAGLLFGTIALLTGIIHFSLDPVSSQKTLGMRIAEKVIAVKKSVISGFKGQQITTSIAPVINPNKTIGIAIVAVICSVVGGMRKENIRIVCGALFFGAGRLIFHAILFSMLIILGRLLIIAVIAFLMCVLN